MTPPRAIPVTDLALTIEATVALEDETLPHRLLSLADEIAELLPSLAEDLRRKARQGVRVRHMLARASLGDLIAVHDGEVPVMPAPHQPQKPFIAAIWDAKTALDEELDPDALRAAAGRLRSFVVEHPLAVRLVAKAQRAEAIRNLFARACRGDV